MTHIDTDNPIIQFRIWLMDFVWLNWYWILLVAIIIWIINIYKKQGYDNRRKSKSL